MIADRMITRCPVGCEGELAETRLTLPEGNLLRCAVCGQLVSQIRESAYLASMMEFDTTSGTLPTESTQRRHDQRAAQVFGTLKTMLNVREGSQLRLLDIGCSSGALLITARQHGFDAEGVEPAERAARAAQAAGFNVFPGTLTDAAYPSASFQAATLMEVIEHLSQPGDLLREVWRVLEPNGILVVGTGNAASWTAQFMRGGWGYFQICRNGGHISFFTPESLARLAARCGFRIDRLETRRVEFVESYQASPVFYRSLKILGEVLNPLARFLNRGHDMRAFLRKV
jgi:2-polyprenyl-3-methyl-5-hydroxy-6-metoxy-1,4-benzoquinol methylase